MNTALVVVFSVLLVGYDFSPATNGTVTNTVKSIHRKSISTHRKDEERLEKKSYQIADAVDRNGRLIPFVTVYVPVESRNTQEHNKYTNAMRSPTAAYGQLLLLNKLSGDNNRLPSPHTTPSITPFLPSNQVPGPFRPMAWDQSPDSFGADADQINPVSVPQQYRASEYQTYRKQQQNYISKPTKFNSYVNFDQNYIQLLPPATDSTTESEYPSQVRQIYQTPKVFSGNVNNRDAITHHKSINNQHSILSQYELDPNDGYMSRIISGVLRSMKNRTNQLKKEQQKQFVPNNSYESPKYKKLQNIYKFSPMTNSYDILPITPNHLLSSPQSTRQHLTETTHIRSPTLHNSHIQPIENLPYTVSAQAPTIIPQTEEQLNPVPIYTQNSIGENIFSPTIEPNPTQSADQNITNTLLTDPFERDNVDVDYSVISLFKILNDFRRANGIVGSPPNHQYYVESNSENTLGYNNHGKKPQKDHTPGPNTGRPGIDYPTLSVIPTTSFSCKEQRYKGFFGDPETNCQVWHYCDLNDGHASFLCPNGTIFSQVLLTCDWWFNVQCSSTAQLYVLNERLYKYILPFSPKFPEDYSGPLVDKYLSIKFQEMDDKMRREKNKNREKSNEKTESESTPTTESTSTPMYDTDTSMIIDDKRHSTDDTEQSNTTNRLQDNEHYEDEEVTTLSPLDVEDTEITTIISEDSMDLTAPTTTFSPPTVQTFEIANEGIKSIEVKSDGSSGHLRPLQNQ